MNENEIIEEIVFTYDWEEVLNNIIIVEGMDPMDIDVGRLTDKFLEYLERMKDFDLRIPGRFILIAALLIKLKAEILLEEERKRQEKEVKVPDIRIRDLPPLDPPAERMPTRKVSLPELIAALNSAMRFQQKKRQKQERMRQRVRELYKEEKETIEDRIMRLYSEIASAGGEVRFSSLISKNTPKEVAEKFMSFLHLVLRSMVRGEQPEQFGEIFIKMIDNSEKGVTEVHVHGNENA